MKYQREYMKYNNPMYDKKISLRSHNNSSKRWSEPAYKDRMLLKLRANPINNPEFYRIILPRLGGRVKKTDTFKKTMRNNMLNNWKSNEFRCKQLAGFTSNVRDSLSKSSKSGWDSLSEEDRKRRLYNLMNSDPRKNYYLCKHRLDDGNGNMLRTKPELIVAKWLTSLGINYDYEKSIKLLNGKIVFPDFTFSVNGRLIRLEFSGCADKEWVSSIICKSYVVKKAYPNDLYYLVTYGDKISNIINSNFDCCIPLSYVKSGGTLQC
jgi:hypothetical protein